MLEELGISFGTALIVLLTLYFIVKWAVKNGIKEAYRDITGKVTTEDIEEEQICNELGLNEEEKQVTSNCINTNLAINTLKTALKKEKHPKVILHSDQGVQFTSCEFVNFCKDNNNKV